MKSKWWQTKQRQTALSFSFSRMRRGEAATTTITLLERVAVSAIAILVGMSILLMLITGIGAIVKFNQDIGFYQRCYKMLDERQLERVHTTERWCIGRDAEGNLVELQP